jgi:hypothetical protein
MYPSFFRRGKATEVAEVYISVQILQNAQKKIERRPLNIPGNKKRRSIKPFISEPTLQTNYLAS